ncbi:uncharacterized protein BP01DRAFT_383778 [Aspergillus saccharolyticus JOP 1030-1]|uniref:Uncharacterized protein n=1 Tax=Aspergillus saccharolyticus JOP 1030-1 TaxID=1450539 RepID=A0A318ZAC3_9EURO|nr:hypothetical protein BP01DRAFT_383778 [Aspergillus saccharolyticus JOP 1030-1]PYH44286.1 hypothetical protein BP01DRAFT_383778 [Aspergillus saccharolyticus JOP 1030-1]
MDITLVTLIALVCAAVARNDLRRRFRRRDSVARRLGHKAQRRDAFCVLHAGDNWNPQEVKDLFQCSVNLMDGYDRGNTGNKASCNMFRYLQNYGNTHSRGGIYEKVSQVLDVICFI